MHVVLLYKHDIILSNSGFRFPHRLSLATRAVLMILEGTSGKTVNLIHAVRGSTSAWVPFIRQPLFTQHTLGSVWMWESVIMGFLRRQCSWRLYSR